MLSKNPVLLVFSLPAKKELVKGFSFIVACVVVRCFAKPKKKLME